MNTRIVITMSGILLATVGIWGVYGGVSYLTYETLTDMTALEEESNQLFRQNDAAKHVEHTFEQTREVRGVLQGRIVEGDDGILQLIDSIESMGVAAGVSLTLHDIDTVQKKEEEKEMACLEVRVTTLGTWRDSMTYTALLETYPWNITITEIGFQHDEETDLWKGNHTFRLLNVIF